MRLHSPVGCPKQESTHAHTFGGDFEFLSSYLDNQPITGNLGWASFFVIEQGPISLISAHSLMV